MTRRIFEDFKYDPKATTVATPLEEVLEKRRGVCQDFAHLGIACLRSLGLPARYVSGYLRTRPPEGKPRLVGADASHAWFSVFCPGTGWVDFDPTNNVQPGEEHIIVAYGRDFGDVSPVAGILTGGGKHDVKVSVDVEPSGLIHEIRHSASHALQLRRARARQFQRCAAPADAHPGADGGIFSAEGAARRAADAFQGFLFQLDQPF